MAYTVTYTVQTTLTTLAEQPSPVEIECIVTAVTEFVDKGIWVLKKDPVTYIYRFDHVATPADLENLNYLQVGETDDNDFARFDTFTKVLNRADLAEAQIDSLESLTLLLCSDMTFLTEYDDPVTVTVP
jgi:hypothetical protein